MDSAVTLVLFALLTAFVGDTAASCRKVDNKDMLEYFCEDGHPADLTTIPETTEKLRIIRMPLRRITADTFAKFGENLWVLSCSHCEIADIDADAFRRLRNLQQLSLDSNHLNTIKATWFEGLDSLTYLDLNYNEIRDIEDGVYKNLPSLVDLRVSGNRLRCLNLDEMSHLRELKRMFLSENADFACPHAVSRFLENQGITFEQDPEWRRLPSDTIDVHVPPSYAEEDMEMVPPYRARLHPDRQPPPEESIAFERDKTFYPDHSEHNRPRQRRPPTTTLRPRQQEELPRVEPRFPDTRPSESESHQVMPHPYPTSGAPSSEDIKMSAIDELSRTEHTLMPPNYPPHPTHETTPHWSYSTPTRSWIPSVSPVDTRTEEIERPPPIVTYPSNIPTREPMPYPSYPTSERSQVSVMGSSQDETIGESGRSSQTGNTVTFPLYSTSDDLDRNPGNLDGFIRVTHPSSANSDMITVGTRARDGSIEHPADPSWTSERNEPSRGPAGGSDRATWSTYYGNDPRKMIVEDSSSQTNYADLYVTLAMTRPVERDRSQTTTTSTVHFVRPSPSEVMYPPTMNEFHQPPYQESAVTVHPPLQNYQDNNDVTAVRPLMTTTTEKPLPDCPGNSAPKSRPAVALVTFIVVTILGHAVVERF